VHALLTLYIVELVFFTGIGLRLLIALCFCCFTVMLWSLKSRHLV